MSILRTMAIFLGFTLAVSTASALELDNDSKERVGVYVSSAARPVYVKVMEPKTSVSFESPVPGPYTVSLKELVSHKEVRLEKVEPDRRVVYNGKKLKVKRPRGKK